jgi:hypothetical protein
MVPRRMRIVNGGGKWNISDAAVLEPEAVLPEASYTIYNPAGVLSSGGQLQDR